MKLKTMLYAAVGALTLKAGKAVAKKKAQDLKSSRDTHDTGRSA
jgi:hypothetical protein